MSKVIWHVTMSLDGFIARPDDSMEWAVGEWSDDGTTTRDIEVDRSQMAEEVLHSAGVILGGRRWYDIVTFVSTPLTEAVAAVRTAAKGKDVVIFGANVAQRCLREGLLDEIVIHLAPVLLGDGTPLFAASDSKPVALRRTRLAESGQITDLRFSVLG